MSGPELITLVTDDQKLVLDKDQVCLIPRVSESLAKGYQEVWLDLDRQELSWFLSYWYSPGEKMSYKGHEATVESMLGDKPSGPWILMKVQDRTFRARLSTLQKSRYLGAMASWNGKVKPEIRLYMDPLAVAHYLSRMRNPEVPRDPVFQGYMETMQLFQDDPVPEDPDQAWFLEDPPLLNKTVVNADTSQFNRDTLCSNWTNPVQGKTLSFEVLGPRAALFIDFWLRAKNLEGSERDHLSHLKEIRVIMRSKDLSTKPRVMERYTNPCKGLKMLMAFRNPVILEVYKRYRAKGQLYFPLCILEDMNTESPRFCHGFKDHLRIEIEFDRPYQGILLHSTVAMEPNKEFQIRSRDHQRITYSTISSEADQDIITLPLYPSVCRAIVFKLDRRAYQLGTRILGAKILDAQGQTMNETCTLSSSTNPQKPEGCLIMPFSNWTLTDTHAWFNLYDGCQLQISLAGRQGKCRVDVLSIEIAIYRIVDNVYESYSLGSLFLPNARNLPEDLYEHFSRGPEDFI